MAHFTEDQAKASKLQSSNKEFTDGNFAYWVLRAADVSVSVIKARMIGHLTGSEYYVAPTPPVVSGSVEFSGNVGDTLG